jgi:hypothetical protein
MPQLKLISVAIDSSGASVDIGPGTHGRDCADIIEGLGQSVGVITRDIWRPEENCAGDCGKCENNYYERQKELRRG